jgi:hypothetical protein
MLTLMEMRSETTMLRERALKVMEKAEMMMEVKANRSMLRKSSTQGNMSPHSEMKLRTVFVDTLLSTAGKRLLSSLIQTIDH